MLDLAIVGGGPGGLMSAWYLKKKLGDLCRVTIYEASDRVGGKILSRKFDSAPALYEAGVAEIYDYSMTGPDPLRELIQHFGLTVNCSTMCRACAVSTARRPLMRSRRFVSAAPTW